MASSFCYILVTSPSIVLLVHCYSCKEKFIVVEVLCATNIGGGGGGGGGGLAIQTAPQSHHMNFRISSSIHNSGYTSLVIPNKTIRCHLENYKHKNHTLFN